MTSNANSKKLTTNNNKQLDKFVSSNSKVINPIGSFLNINQLSNNPNFNQYNPPTVNDRTKPKTSDKRIREREEGFSVYIMGANEERIKNMRKKEQIEKNKNRSDTNSRSTAPRKKWDPLQILTNYANVNTKINDRLGSVERDKGKPESRSKSRVKDVKSPGVDYKVVSKLILGESANKKNTNFLSKHVASKDSISNVEEMLYNINHMKKNMNTHLNKLESPLNNIKDSHNKDSTSNQDKRRRNWAEPRYSIGIIYPEYSSSVEHSNERAKGKNFITDNSILSKDHFNILTSNNKNLNFRNTANIEDLEIFEEEMNNDAFINVVNHLDTISSKNESHHVHQRHLNLSTNANNNFNTSIGMGMKDYTSKLNAVNLLRNSNSSLVVSKNSKADLDLINKERERVSYNADKESHNHYWDENPNYQHTHGTRSKNMTINNSVEMGNKKDLQSSDKLNNSDLLNLSANQNQKDSNLEGSGSTNNVHHHLQSAENATTNFNTKSGISGISGLSGLSPLKKLKSAHTKHRTKSINKVKALNAERPFSSILNVNVNVPRLKNMNSDQLQSSTHKTNNINDFSNVNTNLNNHNIASIQFIYKSPQNKTKSAHIRPLSHIQKAKSIVSKVSVGGTNYNNNVKDNVKEPLHLNLVTQSKINDLNTNNYHNLLAERFSSREQASSNVNVNFANEEKVEMNANNNMNAANRKKKAFPSYPIISNIQVKDNKNSTGGKFPALGATNNTNSNHIQPSLIGSHSKKRYDILSKIEQLDDRKLNKLARVVEELANSAEQSDMSLLDSINLKHSSKNAQNLIFNSIKDKFNINYIKADSVNFGNININVNNNKTNTNHNHNASQNNNVKISNKKTFDEEFNNLLNDEEQSPSFQRQRDSVKQNIFSSSQTLNPFKCIKRAATINPIISNYSVISISILSTWGNTEKLGLTEIQIFDNKNKKIEIIECHVFNGTEDAISKVYNNKFHTTEENDMWVSNCIPNVKIEIYFEAVFEVGKIVIWNYNARDLTKGAKEIEIFKRNSFVWKGIINKGSFNAKTDYSTKVYLTPPTSTTANQANTLKHDNNFELTNILMDTSDMINEMYINSPTRTKLSYTQSEQKATDSKLLREDLEPEDLMKASINSSVNKIIINRKDKNTSNNNSHRNSDLLNSSLTGMNMLNSARNNSISNELLCENSHNILMTSIGKTAGNNFSNILGNLKSSTSLTKMNSNSVNCKRIKVIISSNYGDSSFVGLTGLQFLNDKEEVINIDKAKTIGAMPKDVNTVYNNGDPRIFENIFNSVNEATEDYNMWLTPFNPSSAPFIELSFEKAVKLSAIKFWNYNKVGQLQRGAKILKLILDENYHDTKTIILRKALGEENVDYSQTVLFPIVPLNLTEEELEPFKSIKPASMSFTQDFETPYLPTGFIFKLSLLSTHGDPHYIGLNGVEFFDQLGHSVFKYNNPRIIASPSAVNELAGMEEDVRYVDNLLNGFNSSSSGSNSWLAPFLNSKSVIEDNLNNTFSNKNMASCEYNSKPNTVYFIFDRPVTLSYIHFWNYTSNPSRGVDEIHITCDDSIIYKGNLRQSDKERDNSTLILFTSDYNVTKHLSDKLLPDGRNKHKYVSTEKLYKDENSSCYVMHIDNKDIGNCNGERPYTMEK